MEEIMGEYSELKLPPDQSNSGIDEEIMKQKNNGSTVKSYLDKVKNKNHINEDKTKENAKISEVNKNNTIKIENKCSVKSADHTKEGLQHIIKIKEEKMDCETDEKNEPEKIVIKVEISDYPVEEIEQDDLKGEINSEVENKAVAELKQNEEAPDYNCMNYLEVQLEEGGNAESLEKKEMVNSKATEIITQSYPSIVPLSLTAGEPSVRTEGENAHMCPVCYKTFAKKKALGKHSLIHRPVRPHACNVCSKSFIQRGDLKKHLMVHTGDKPYQCELCSRKFTQRTDLNKHMYTHAGIKPYTCEFCPKSYAQRSHLVNHTFTHYGVQPYPCTLCPRKFTQSSDLTMHMVKHSGVRAYVCKICNKSYTQSSHLTSHMLYHSGNRPYQCEVCCVAFAEKSKLARHFITPKHQENLKIKSNVST